MEKGRQIDGSSRAQGLSGLFAFIRNRLGYWPLATCFVLFFMFSYGAQPLLYKLINPELGQGFPPLLDSALSLLIATAVLILFLAGLTSIRFRHQPKTPERELEFSFLIPIFLVVVSAGIAANWALLAVGGGVTIYTYGFQMPGSFSGVMSAIRLIAFPAVLAILLLIDSSKSRKQLPIMIVGTFLFGAASSIASGSHLVAIATALPILFAGRLNRPGRITLFAVVLAIQLILAAGSRIFFLPFWFEEDWTIHDLYYEGWIQNGSPILPILLTPILYPINRVSGLYELSLTSRFLDGSYFADFTLVPVLNFFIPPLGMPTSLGARDVLGIEDSMGGFGLDLVSNLWLAFGPNVFALGLGSFIMGAIVGGAYRGMNKILGTLGLPINNLAISLGLLLLAFSPSHAPLLLILSVGGLSLSRLIEGLNSSRGEMRQPTAKTQNSMLSFPHRATGNK